MSENFDKTRVFKPNDNQVGKKTRSNLKNNKSNGKNRKLKRKFKIIYLVPMAVLICVLIFVVYLWKTTQNDGPVYGDRCDGITEVSNTLMDTVASTMKDENASIASLTINKVCRQIKINLVVTAGVSIEDAENLAATILQRLDSQAGLSKASEEDVYSTLFGYINEEQQYHVRFLITSEDEAAVSFPSYGAKHPDNQYLSFTRNETRDPDLVQELIEKQTKTSDGTKSETPVDGTNEDDYPDD